MSGRTSVAERPFFAIDVPRERRDQLMEYLNQHPSLLRLCQEGRVEAAAQEIEKDPGHHAIASGLRNCAANWTH